MISEIIEICYMKEDKRREEVIVKERKKNMLLPQKPNQVNPVKTKWDVPLEPVNFLYK